MIRWTSIALGLTLAAAFTSCEDHPISAIAPNTDRIDFVHSLCRTQEVAVATPINYDVPPWDDAIGAQAGIWWTPQRGIVGYSFQEDGLVYRTLTAADICPVYREF